MWHTGNSIVHSKSFKQDEDKTRFPASRKHQTHSSAPQNNELMNFRHVIQSCPPLSSSGAASSLSWGSEPLSVQRGASFFTSGAIFLTLEDGLLFMFGVVSGLIFSTSRPCTMASSLSKLRRPMPEWNLKGVKRTAKPAIAGTAGDFFLGRSPNGYL